MTESVESLNAHVSLPGSRGTLSDLLAQQTRLAFSTVVDYLAQLSEAIDLAHEQGFIHCNINPSNILLTAEGHLVILGLRSAGDRKDPRSSRREARWASYEGTRLMTLAYMAPEQMLAGDILSPEARQISNIAGMERAVDGRADLYALGVILYQMVTGVLPFQAESPEQMALKHLRMPPPSPRQLRPDLPIAAEQAMLRALAKRSADRYVRAQDLATAFGVALIAADILLIEPADPQGRRASVVLPIESADAKRSHANGVADSHFKVQLNDQPEVEMQPMTLGYLPGGQYSNPSLHQPFVPSASPSATIRSFQQASDEALGAPTPLQAEGWGPLSRSVPAVDNDVDEDQPTNPVPVVNAAPSLSTGDAPMPLSPFSPVAQETFSTTPAYPVEADVSCPPPIDRPASPEPPVPASTSTGAQPAIVPSGYDPISPLPATSTTGMLALSNFQQGNTGTLKLTGPAKIVQVPVAGQPGLYVTGLLPVFPQQPSPSGALASTSLAQSGRNNGRIIFTLAVVVMLVVFGSGLFWFIHIHSGQTNKQSVSIVAPNLHATATAKAIATANANIILTDPLNQNIHNWPIQTTGSMIFVFKNDAYHVIDNNPTEGAPAILPDEILHGSFAYTLTMQEIRGDDTSINNEFGMIIRANSQNKYGKIITTFYSFEVLNTKSGEYQFWKYDNSKGPSVIPWTKLWHQSFGKEFHQGHGPGSINTFKIFVNGKSFTLIVNGKRIATVQDTSCTAALCSAGAVGMLVNLKGTEVAFSNLKLTYS